MKNPLFKPVALTLMLCAGSALCAPIFIAPAHAAITVAEGEIYWSASLVVGSTPPVLTEKTLDGKAFSFADYKGKVVLLDFWATWCPPCRDAIPNIKANYEKYRAQGFEVVGISLDFSDVELREFIKDKEMAWPQLFDAKHPAVEAYGVKGIPFTLLIGKDGKIAAVNPHDEEIEIAVKAALAK